MSETFPCPYCGIRFGWKAELVGRTAKCRKCGHSFSVPDLSGAPLSSLLDEELLDAGAAGATRPETGAAGNDRPALGRRVTLDNSTEASNPGLVRVQWAKYLACYPWESVLTLFACVVAAGLAVTFGQKQVPPAVSVAAGVVAVLAGVRWQLLKCKEHFFHGCVCPAVVISTNPYLIAAATDLTTAAEDSYPAIKVMKQPLDKMTGGPPEIGTRLATVAIYHGDLKSGCWSDFEPLAVNCVTTDEREIARVLGSITREEWDDLDRGVRQMPGRPKTGDLFFVE